MDLDTSRPFSGSDAVRAGLLTWGLLTGPGFRRLLFDTYVAADVPDTPLLAVRAALVRGGPLAVATGWSACVVLGLDVAPPRPKPVEIASPDRQLRPGPGLVAARKGFAPGDVVVENGCRTTSPLRTAYDLATRSGPAATALDRVAGPLADALVAADALARLGGFGAEDLLAVPGPRSRARGRAGLRRVAALLDPRSESPSETRVRLQVILAGLPRPELQWPVTGPGRDRRLDLAWPEYGVAVEYDGRDHALADRRGRDIDRLDALRAQGWIVIVVTARQLARPMWVPDRVRAALISRGWVPES
jgi:hypothetical protein